MDTNALCIMKTKLIASSKKKKLNLSEKEGDDLEIDWLNPEVDIAAGTYLGQMCLLR